MSWKDAPIVPLIWHQKTEPKPNSPKSMVQSSTNTILKKTEPHQTINPPSNTNYWGD